MVHDLDSASYMCRLVPWAGGCMRREYGLEIAGSKRILLHARDRPDHWRERWLIMSRFYKTNTSNSTSCRALIQQTFRPSLLKSFLPSNQPFPSQFDLPRRLSRLPAALGHTHCAAIAELELVLRGGEGAGAMMWKMYAGERAGTEVVGAIS